VTIWRQILVGPADEYPRPGAQGPTSYGRAKESKLVLDTIKECRAFVLDIAEDKLFAAAKKGRIDAIKFLLKTKGKRRGCAKQ
jgi:hypothetical protein